MVGLPLDARSRYEEGRLVGIDYTHPAIALPEDHLPEPTSGDGPASPVAVCDFLRFPRGHLAVPGALVRRGRDRAVLTWR